MKVCHTLICCFFLSLQDENTALVNAEILVYSATEGGEVTVQCSFSSYRRRKFFCRGECEKEDILIKTTENRAQSGRYSIEYEIGELSVTIAQLTKSDSGTYHCGLGTTSLLYVELGIIVTDALLDGSHDASEAKPLHKRTGENITVECSFTQSGRRKQFCKEECEKTKDVLVVTTGDTDQSGRYSIVYLRGSTGGFLFVTIAQLVESDSGRYRCALDSNTHRDFDVIVTDGPSASTTTSTPLSDLPKITDQLQPETTDLTLPVGLTLVVMVSLLSVAALCFCRNRTSKLKEPPVETQRASVSEANQVYEEISPIYTNAIYTKRVKTNDEYSFVTAATSQHKAEDCSSQVTYAQVNFSNRTTRSANNTPHGDDDDVVYSVLQASGR